MRTNQLSEAQLGALGPEEFFMANVGGVPLTPIQGNSGPGIFYVGNDTGRFDTAYFSEPLTAYAAGWTDSDKVDQLLDFIAPPVPVSQRFEYTEWPNPEVYQSESDDVRAIGADFKRVAYTQGKVQARTYNKGLTMRVDLDEWSGTPNWKERLTGMLLKRIIRNDARRAFALLAAAATAGTKTWSTGATDKDPDVDIIGYIDSFGDVMGINANRVLYGFTAWRYRLMGYGVQNTAAGFGGRGVQTPEQLANVLGVDKVFVSKERYTNAAATKAKIVTAAQVLVFRGEDNISKDDPSTFKRFVTFTGGQKFRVFEAIVPPGKFIDISVEHYSDIVHTGKFTVGASTYDGAYKITIS